MHSFIISERYIRELDSYHFTIPSKVTALGDHLSHSLHPNFRRKRSPGDDTSIDHTLHYKLNINNKDFILKVRPNYKLLSPSLVIERKTNVFKNVSDSIFTHGASDHCHFIGEVKDHHRSSIALEVCNGLVSYFQILKL